MGGHRVVARNGPTNLSTKMVKNGPAWRVLDDEFEQIHRRIGQAPSGGFDEEDCEVIRVRGDVSEDGSILPSLLVRGPGLLDPRDASSWEDRVITTVGVEDRSGEVGGCGGIADSHIDVLPVGGVDETAVGSGRSRVPVRLVRIAGGQSGG